MNRAEVRRRQAGELSNLLTLITIWILGGRIGGNGIAYITAGLGICGLLCCLVSGFVSEGLGRLLRSRKNKGQYKSIEKMCKNAMIFQMILGMAGSLLLCILAGRIADGIFGLSYIRLIIMIASPVIFLRSVSAVLMGYFQGDGMEIPTAAAGVLRAAFILGFGLLFSGIFGSYGDKAGSLLRQENFSAMYRGMGIALAVSLSEVLIVVFLGLIYKAGGYSKKRNRQEGMGSADSAFECIRYLWGSRWVQAVTVFLVALPLVLGLFLFGRGAEDENAVAGDFSLYAGNYLILCGAIVCILAVLMLPVIAKIFISFRKNEHRFGRTIFQSGMHICLVHSIFLSVFIAVMAEQIAGLLCPESKDKLLPMLQGGSFFIVFAALAFYFFRFLQTMGKKYYVLAAAVTGNVLFAVITFVTGKAGILSLVYGSLTGIFVFCMVLGVFACGQLRIRINWLDILVMPLGTGAAAGLVCMLLGKLIAPHMHPLITLLVTFVIAGALYWIVLVLLRCFKDQELEVIPGGRMLNSLRQMLHIY